MKNKASSHEGDKDRHSTRHTEHGTRNTEHGHVTTPQKTTPDGAHTDHKEHTLRRELESEADDGVEEQAAGDYAGGARIAMATSIPGIHHTLLGLYSLGTPYKLCFRGRNYF